MLRCQSFNNMFIQKISSSSHVLSPVLNAGPMEMKGTWYLMPKNSVLFGKTFMNCDTDSNTIPPDDTGVSSS